MDRRIDPSAERRGRAALPGLEDGHADDRSRTGLLVRTNLDESEYIDEKGDRFKVLAGTRSRT